MGQKIEIKPGDQSWVGKKIRGGSWIKSQFISVLYVGKELIFAREKDQYEVIWRIENQDWELYEESKPEPKKVLKAPAFYKNGYDYRDVQPTPITFIDEKSARDYYGVFFVSWPAIPNKDGFYEVPE